MPNNDYANEPNQSRSEDIIQSILDNTEYDEPARSRIEYLLVELKNAIEGGGGGTGTDNYNELNNKPSINGTVLSGNKSLDNLGIQAKLTFDSAPTEDSENPVESGGVYSALAGKQDTISDLSTIRSGAAAGATAVQPADMASALSQKQDALSTAQLSAVNSGITTEDVAQIKTNKNNILLISENNITKNYFDYYNATIVNTYITKFTNNNDGTFTLKSNDATSGVVVPYISITLKAGQYVLSGCPPTGSDNTYRLDIRSDSGGVIDNSADYGSGSSTFTIESDGQYRLGFRFASGYTFPVDGLIFKPMICTPEQWSITHEYQPYIMTNAEITAWILSQS